MYSSPALKMQAVSTLTTRCLLLRSGETVCDGPPRAVIARYLADGSAGPPVFTAVPAPTMTLQIRLPGGALTIGLARTWSV